MANNDGAYKLYRYDPSLAAAIVALVIFILLSIAQAYTSVRHRLWFFIPFYIGCLLEIIGYVGRIANATQSPDWALSPYIVQALCLLLPPVFFAATIYMTLGRLISALDGQAYAVVPPNWNTKAFVIGDVFSFLLQSAGGGILSKGTASSLTLGRNIIVGGLVLQLIYFTLFVIFAAVFQRRFQAKASMSQRATVLPWQRMLTVLYVASLLIFVRSLFRTVEYAQGNNGYLTRHEIFFYIFDTLLMAIVVALYTVAPPKELAAREMRRREGGYTIEGGIAKH